MKLSTQELLNRYAKLVVECGWGGSAGIKGKPVHIMHGTPAYPLVLAIAAEAYKVGAARVDTTLWSPALEALHVTYATDENLVKIPKHWADRWNDLVAVRGATLRIEGVDDPMALSKCDPKRVGQFESARIKARELFYNEGLHKNTTPWSIIPFATVDWANLLFPETSGEPARLKLESALVSILGLEHDDYIERWWARGTKIAKRSRLLDGLHATALEFVGPETALRVGLHSLARFGGGMHDGGGSDSAPRFFANLPTFENYTTPHCAQVSGHVAMTRPILINGQNVSGLKVWFDNGKVARFTAEQGAEAFQAMLNEDDGAKMLGEVALVGIDDSPIYSTGIVFQSILLDENAACHIAFGRAYPDRLEGGTEMNETERLAVGCNNSKVHRDCMISNEHTSVFAILPDGSKALVIEKGCWAGKFAA